ncbi:MAG TPA: hypothetical protein VFQ39_17840, partial [Longimicrobium sp.]|nr:hypothetical protein [Longimicrobium sp.]
KEAMRQDSIYRANHPDTATASPDSLVSVPPPGGLRINPQTGEPAPGADVVPPPPARPSTPVRPRVKDPRRLPDAPRDTRPWIPPPAELHRDSTKAAAPPPPPRPEPAQP